MTWSRSARVRWICSEESKLEADAQTAILVVLNWPVSQDGANKSHELCEKIRSRFPDLPILLLKQESGRDVDLHLDEAVSKFAPAEKIVGRSLFHESEPLDNALKKLGVVLPPPVIGLDINENDLAVWELLTWLGAKRGDGKERLSLITQKFFPDAQRARVTPVSGGWSGTRLCHVFVAEKPYFLKFFEKADSHETELRNHTRAKSWLGPVLVDLKLVPEIPGGIEAQAEAFPLKEDPAALPVCYESASTLQDRRETLKEYYRTEPNDAKVEQSFRRVLDILASGQDNLRCSAEVPWTNVSTDEFYLQPVIKQNILGALNDLHVYGETMATRCSGNWPACRHALERFVHQQEPSWLYEPARVLRGHIHGDPNPRNCLVRPSTCSDVLMIDSGGYRDNGRLVSDLAIIERDLKLVLLATEKHVDQYYDLDISHLPEWCQAERDALGRGLEFVPANAPAPIKGEVPYTAISRAYRLIGLVRERAKLVCQAAGDTDGKHYFAALLYWTLDMLQNPSVRPTKKLLALYSAAEILL
ncbi:MAG: hypothetical protein NTZ09_08300 [Candidatus Hydrogenedentes bacterium]|nr:hypothetical protein [Candidatus Hydrogenedentota bacterium]